MTSNEQLELSTYIKTVHKKLRVDSKLLGHERAWEKHCDDKETLEKYATAMKELAVCHWKENERKDPKVQSRIDWIHDNCISYFKGGGLKYQRDREFDIAVKNKLDIKLHQNTEELDTYKALDVGSCYNPFKIFKDFDVLPIDISPADGDVLLCDFLNVKIVEDLPDNDHRKVRQLQSHSFHIVVFCLLLEYLPCADQRLECCQKAYRLLKPEGLLVIITPDSKHVGANAKYMKAWRCVLAELGFCRIKYEKLTYLHCMLFRKSLNPEVANRWATLNKGRQAYDGIFIPQDFNNQDNVNKGGKG